MQFGLEGIDLGDGDLKGSLQAVPPVLGVPLHLPDHRLSLLDHRLRVIPQLG
jgi:hypothetical protein